jgi:hypothetical protein
MKGSPVRVRASAFSAHLQLDEGSLAAADQITMQTIFDNVQRRSHSVLRSHGLRGLDAWSFREAGVEAHWFVESM